MNQGDRKMTSEPTIDIPAIGMRLKELRKQSGLAQKHIAEYLGVDQSMIARHENGDRNMTTETLEKLALLYGCTINFLLTGESGRTVPAFSFQANEISVEDLRAIAEINKITLNQMLIDQLLFE